MVVKRHPESAAIPILDAFRQACLASGFPADPDINSATSAGVAFTPTNAVHGRRMNAAVRYLIPVEGRPNLTIQDRTFVRAVTFTSGRADGVSYHRDGVDEAVSADEIVLCAGGINTPHLLILSGVGPAGQLQALGIDVVHDSPNVGKNLMDHPFVGVAYRTAKGGPVPGGPLPVGPMILNYTATTRRSSTTCACSRRSTRNPLCCSALATRASPTAPEVPGSSETRRRPGKVCGADPRELRSKISGDAKTCTCSSSSAWS